MKTVQPQMSLVPRWRNPDTQEKKKKKKNNQEKWLGKCQNRGLSGYRKAEVSGFSPATITQGRVRKMWRKASTSFTHAGASAWHLSPLLLCHLSIASLFLPFVISLYVTYVKDLPGLPFKISLSQTPCHHLLPQFPLLFLPNSYRSFELHAYWGAN